MAEWFYLNISDCRYIYSPKNQFFNILQDRKVIHFQDVKGVSPLHVACMNLNDEGPDIVDIMLDVDPLSARRTDSLGQLPLHTGDFDEYCMTYFIHSIVLWNRLNSK